MFWIVWNRAKNEGFATKNFDDAHQASTGQFNSTRSSLGEEFRDTYQDEVEESGQALEIEEVPAIAAADAAVQIGEEAFRAGFKAAAHFAESYFGIDADTPLSPKAAEALERAWAAYEPSEAVKEMIA